MSLLAPGRPEAASAALSYDARGLFSSTNLLTRKLNHVIFTEKGVFGK